MQNNNNLVGLWPNLSRAYEIALAGKFTIQCVFEKEYTAGFEDYKKIKSFFDGVDFVSDGNLIVELYKPSVNKPHHEFETLKDIIARVYDVKDNVTPFVFDNEHAANALLKTAVERLSLSISKRNNILKVAGVIARLDKCDKIRTEHLAEAINYNHVYLDQVCNAESEYIEFGPGIKISLHSLHAYDINAAIEYLKSL